MKEPIRVTTPTFRVFEPELIMNTPELRVTTESEAINLADLIETACEEFETFTGNVLRESLWDVYLDAFPESDPIETPAPLLSVEEIVYLDAAGVSQTLDPSYYVVDNASPKQLGRISLASGMAFPATYDQANAVRVRINAGYESPDAVPFLIRRGLLAFIQGVYDGLLPEERDRMIRSYWKSYRRFIV